MSFLTKLGGLFQRDVDVEAKWTVTFNGDEVYSTRPNGKVESLRWDDLEVVAVETTDEGPYVMDVFWYLAGKDSGCVVPNGATGVTEMLTRLQTLEGFDNEALSKAMASTSNARFILWRKNAT